MAAGAARQRGARRKGKPTTRHTFQETDSGPASRSQLLRGWNSVSGQEQPFSLSQEARNTHASVWKASTRLRDNAIRFVSGGNLHQESSEKDQKKEVGDLSADSSCVSGKQGGNEPGSRDGAIQEPPESLKKQDATTSHIAEEDILISKQIADLDLYDRNGGSPLNQRRSASTSSASSNEVILFAGRGNAPKVREQGSTPPNPQNHPIDQTLPSKSNTFPPTDPPPADRSSRLSPDAGDIVPTQSVSKELNKQQPSDRDRSVIGPLLSDSDDDEAILQDYIENMKENHELDPEDDECEKGHQGLGWEDGKSPVLAFHPPTESTRRFHGNDWNSDDLRDFDDLETSDDDPAEFGAVLSRRERSTGIQYLVTPLGLSVDYAKWILKEKLVSINAAEMVLAFDKSHPNGCTVNEHGEIPCKDSWSDESEEEPSNDPLLDHESEENENERILRHTSQMTDFEIARVLGKQEELGISSNEILLLDGDLARDRGLGHLANDRRAPRRGISRRKPVSKGAFPSAAAFAEILDEDPYTGFDVMDFDRPSLKQKKKGRKSAGGLPFELEDDELADQLARSWANDRSKKAARKAEREELRQAGLLRQKSGKGWSDVRSGEEMNGMDMDEVKAEVRAFLLEEDQEVLPLVPMSSPQRAQVHQLARALHLKSHSQGKGDGRFPVLTKTDYSGRYDAGNIGQIDALLANRKFSTRWGKKDKTTARLDGGAKRGGGRGGNAAGATYMDGDVVGASAPMLGSDNKGRAMLEKMGWSAGMGIGKVGNKGSVEVIKHVVKNTKAGLG